MPSFRKAKSNNWLGNEQFGDFSSIENDGGSNETKRPVGGAGARKRGRENNNSIKKPPGKSFSCADIPFDYVTPSSKSSVNVELSSSDDLWINRHHPQSCEDLAVNSKKVEELRSRLGDSLTQGGILLLTGPAGAGKTAALRAVARSLGVELKEWVNPVEQVNYGPSRLVEDDEGGGGWGHSYGDVVTYTSKSRQFRDWLRGAKYSSVGAGGSLKKIILVEDLPSTKAEELQDVLESYSNSKIRIPLVFIISESATSKTSASVKQIFPPQVVERLKILSISFNPVTTTNMVRTMTKIAVNESQRGLRRFQVPDKATLENLAESVGGDLRAGINALQFACLNDTRDLKKAFEGVSMIASSKSTSKGSKKPSGKSVTELSKIGGKDHGLVMFHALGKILYNKREEALETAGLPQHLEHQRRKVMKSNPDEVIDKSTLSADAFTCFLHQNYPPFFSKLEDVETLSEYISLADMFLNEWSSGGTGKVSLTEYGSMVAARAVMFTNTAPPANMGMRKLNKPEHYSAVRTVRQRHYDLHNIFSTQPRRELVTSTLPLIARIRPASLPQHKLSTVLDIGTFTGIKQTTFRAQAVIEQDDMFNEADETVTQDLVNNREEDNVEMAAGDMIDNDEELIIEEFDD